MKNNHPILIVEDDVDDREFIQSALHAIGVKNEQVCFRDGESALKYLQTSDQETFLILSDINMPRLNGIELKKAINEDDGLRKKSIPFVFLTTSCAKKEVEKAFDLMAQGFFTKPKNLNELKDTLQKVVGYWNACKHPGS